MAYLTFTKATMATLFPGWPGAVTDLNVGVIALTLNVAVMAAVSAVSAVGVRQPTRRSVGQSVGR